MSKNVAVFVDVANIFYAAKAANVDIDYVTLLKSAVAGRDFVRAYAYTGLDPENENQRNFHQFLARHGYKVVSKDIRKYGDGKVKANLDIELVVDMMKTARNLDVAIVVSGDGDFAPAIRAVQEMGVRVEVISFRGNTSSDLIDVADVFTDITQIAKVEKGSRSGRRVAGDEEDLSMTEVPEKQTEGPARPRSRRGGRGRGAEKEVAASAGRSGHAAEERNGERAPASLTVLPGEKLSGSAARHEDVGALAAFGEGGPEHEDELATATAGGESTEIGEDGQPRRRRRRRGGRGRGRGRGTETTLPGGLEAETDEEEDLEALAPRPAARAGSFGSVWDSQLGVPSSASRGGSPSTTPFDEEDEDFEEPEIPEYLIAERRRGQGGQGGRGRQQGGGRGRGRNAAYAAAVERERFGGRSGGTRYAEPPRTRLQQPAPRHEQRPQAPRSEARPQGGRPRGTEPWSEVPPELEEMLRSQLAGRVEPGQRVPAQRQQSESAAPGEESPAAAEPTPTPTRRRAPSRRTAASEVTAATTDAATEAPAEETATPKRRTTRRSTKATVEAAAGTDTASDAVPEATADAVTPKPRATRTTRARTTRSSSTNAPGTAAGTTATGDGEAATAPAKPRTRRRSTTASE